MPITTAPKYLIDGIPHNPHELICAAASIDETFAEDWLKQTSAAADILRSAGHTVEHNPEYTQLPESSND